MSLVCAARFAQDWGRLHHLIQASSPGANIGPEQEAIDLCIRADLALFRNNDPALARALYGQALETSPSIPDARYRLACMTLFDDGRFDLDGSGYGSRSVADLAPAVVDDAYNWLAAVRLSDQLGPGRSVSELAQTPYRWLLTTSSLYVRGLIEERRCQWQAASQTYTQISSLLIFPVLNVVAAPSAIPDLSAADPDRIGQLSNLVTAALAAQCRALLRLGQYDRFLDLARAWSRSDGDLAVVPRVQRAFRRRFAEQLIFYNVGLYRSYHDRDPARRRYGFRSPLEEAALLLWLGLDRSSGDGADDDLRLSTRLLLSLSDQFPAIADLYRDHVALDLSNPQLWFTRCLALCCAENYNEAYAAAKASIRLQPEAIDPLLFAAKLLLNHLSNPKQALKFAEDAFTLCPTTHPLRASCHFVSAIASSRLAYEVWTFSRRKLLQQEALQHAIEAAKYQPRNQKFIFGIAAVQADIREVNLAVRLVRHSLALNSSHFESWHLMALLLTSQKQYDAAVQVCIAGSSECHYSYHLEFILTQCMVLTGQLLSEGLGAGDQSVVVTRALQSFQTLFSGALVDPAQVKFVALGPYHSCPVLLRRTDVDVPATFTQQALAGKPPHALQSFCSPAFKYADPDALRYRAVLSLIDLYAFVARAPALNLTDALPLAYSCLDYLFGLGSASWLPDIYVKLGQLCEQTGDDVGALSHYELALSFDGQHTDALVRIGALHNKMQKPVIAHEYLLTALRIDSTLHDAWLEIGAILHAQGKYDAAMEAIATALELERTAPVETFYAVARHL